VATGVGLGVSLGAGAGVGVGVGAGFSSAHPRVKAAILKTAITNTRIFHFVLIF
jgi:hypothetical protein